MDYKTPGVFVEELSLIPPSVAAVATAIPAFIGHTALTTDPGGKTLLNRPVRITSMLEYTSLYGGAYTPATVTVKLDAQNNITDVTPVSGRKFFLFDALQHFFDNGGGPCYIVSVGNYTTDVTLGNATTGLLGGLTAVSKEDEPTIICAPDTCALKEGDGTPDFVNSGNFHKAAIAQCAKLQDRFAVLDIPGGQLGLAHAENPIGNFRTQVGNQELKYAAAYYPWLQSSYPQNLRFTQLAFIDQANAAIPDGTINNIVPADSALVTGLRDRLLEEARVFSKIPSPVLNRSNYNPISAHFETLRMGVMTAINVANARTAFAPLMTFVRNVALSMRKLEMDAGNTPAMIHVLNTLKANTDLRLQLIALIAFEKNGAILSSHPAPPRTDAMVNTDYTDLNATDWIAGATLASIQPELNPYTGATPLATVQNVANSVTLSKAFEKVADAFMAVLQDAINRTDNAELLLFTRHPFFKGVVERVKFEMSLLPPSGAVAGIYAATDRTRGVWKAPANMSLRSVVAPAVKLNDQEQSGLNVNENGKSVNAIRAFTGKGILVWGARTLAGNDNEWRYVNVRRFFTFVEESTKKASEPFVFENNDANTWVRIRAMLENFLTLQWRQGALAGATTKQAFYVKVGLGETMTAQDILEGRLIVEIGMAAVRPAEFIVLRFSHKMQES
ncbi:phage tail sheath C-terminal domain-containing protein [Chitinophaga deserti]|uniref:phage tail sheath C-terminal domain-containing protein n=1 Tax=Chitinophaga deserti TaxID=2164099 RepID=UPI000D6D121E|nr:phage tail sheath C-terminal domain-containing protein [Chitinophaga deserti]